MATEADIPAPVCETRTEQGFHIADQATNISNNKLPQEEKNRADAHNEPATDAEEDFLPTPSIDQVHCEVNKMSSDATEKDETVVSLVTSPELDDQSLQSAANAVDPCETIQHKDEKSNVSDKDVRVETELSKDTTHGKTTEGDISVNLATSDESKEVECEHNKIPPERNFADSLEIAVEKATDEPKVTETDEESPLVQVDNEQFEKESEKLPLADLSTDGNESTFIDEKEGPTKAQLFETEENITTSLQEDVDTEKPVESLHEVPDIIEASDLSKENKTTSSPEEYGTNANQRVIASDDTEEKAIDAVEEHKEVLESFPTTVSSSSKEESTTAESECVDEKTIDKVDTRKEILEDFSTVVQNEEIEENSNKVDGSDTKDEETLEKGREEMSLPLPLAREANVDEPMVMHEAGVERGELRKTKLCENESTESIEKPEDSLNVVSEDIKESDPDQEIETRSHTEEQIEAAKPQADLDGKTDDKTLDVAETKEEILEKTERGIHIADQATNPADTHNEPCTVEGKDFLTTPSVDQVYCEVNKTSTDPTEQPDQTEKDETVIPLLRSPELDDQSLQSAADAVDSYDEIQQTAEKSNVSDKDVRVETELSKDTTEEDVLGNLTSDESKEVEYEHNKMPPEGEVVSHERNFADSLEIGAESASQDNSSSVETITNTTSGDEFQGKNNLDSSFCEDDTTKAELFETEDNVTTLLKEDVDTEKPVEFLHEVPEVIEASDLSQENKTTSSPEEDSTNANQHVIAGDDTEEKTIDAVEEHKEVLESFPIIVSSSPKEESVTAESECMDEKAVDKVDTQKEILEEISAVVPNEEIEENSNKVDGSDTKDEETLEKESDEMSLPLPLTREANDDESIIKPEDSLNVVSEGIKESDLDREIETRSYTEEQIEAAQPQAAMDEKTDDKTLDAAETKEEILENVPTCVLDDKTEEGEYLVQDDSTKVKNEDHLEKDGEEASNDDVITAMDEVKVEVEYPSRAKLFQDEKNDGADFNEKTQELQQSVEINVSTEDNDRELEKEIVTPSLEEASTKEAPEESTESTLLKKEHLQDHEASASSDDIEINHTLEDQSLTAIPHAITSERTIDPTDTKAVCLEVQNVATEIPHMESEAHLGKESEKSSLTEETNDTESKNLSEPKEDKDLVEAELSEKENNSAITLVTEKSEEIMESDFGEKTTNPQEISSDKPEEETIDAVEREEEILHVQGIATSIPDGDNEDKSSIEEDCSQHPSSNETSSGQANDDEAAITREANFVDESLIKAESFESEKNAEVNLVKEEVSIEPLQVAANDIKDSAVEQDREISFNEYKTKEENHEEMVEHLQKDSDSTSLAEAPTMDTIESTEEIGESGSGQSTETTSTEEQILTGDTQEISRDKTEEKSDDAAYTEGNTIDVQDTETNEDSSPIEEDCSERPSAIIHEAKLADQNLIKAELFENEESTEGSLAKEELSTRSLEVSDEDTRASASDQDRETSSIEEQGLTTSTSGIIDDQKEDKTIDATETPEDKNVATTTLDEETEEDLLVQVACQKDDPEKESENTSQIGETTESTLKDDAEVEKAADSFEVVNEDTKDNCEESTIIHESEVADQGLLKDELFENAKNTEVYLAQQEVSIRSLEVSDEDIKASGSGKDREISSIEEDNTIDATETPEDKNVATTLHEETEKNSPIQVACQKDDPEKESETTPPTGETTESTLKDDAVVEKAADSFEVVNEDINESKLADQNLIKAELLENEESTEGNLAKEELSIRSLEVSDEDIKASASGQDRETCSIEEQGLTTSTSGIIDDQKEDKTIDATETPEDKNIATTTLQEETEENSLIQVDFQKEDLENESENTSQTVETSESTLKDDALVEKVVDSFEVVKEDSKASAFVSTGNDNYEESTVIHESKVTDQSLIKAGLFENAKNTEVYLAQQEVSIRSLEVSDEDIKASTPGQDIETCSTEEKGLTTSPSGIIDDQKEDKTIDATESPEDKNVATTTLHEETEENSPIQVDCQKEELEKESEDTSQTGETTETTLKDDTVVAKAADSFEVVNEDIKAPAFVFTGNDNDEEPTIIHEPKLADQNLIKAELFENEESTEGDLAKEEVSIRSLEVSNEDIKASALGQDREICSLEEQDQTTSPSGIIDDQREDKAVDATESLEDKNVATTTLHDETENNSLIQVDSQKEHLEKETENTSQTGETTESNLKDDKEEQIQNADLQEISCDKAEEKAFDATYTEGQTLEVRDVDTDVQSEQNEDYSTIEEDGSEKPSLEEASRGDANEDGSLVKVGLFENEKNTEDTLLKEEASVEPIQAPTEDIKVSDSSQETETNSLSVQCKSINPQDIMGSNQGDGTTDTTDLKEKNLEHKNITPTPPYEDSEDKSLIQVHYSQMEQNEHSEKESGTSTLTEAKTLDTIESSLLKETHVEKPIGSSQVNTDDIKESTSSQETKTRSIDVETPTAEAQETLSDEINEQTTDVTDAKEDCLEVQDITINVPNGDNEDNSPTKADSSQKPSLEEAPMGNAEDHDSIIMHQAKFVDENLIKANLFENEKTTEGTLIKEETESLQFADGDIKAPASCEDREISSLEEQSLIADPTGNMAEEKEDETIDPTDLSEETSKDKVPKEIDAVETKAVITELNEEEIYLRDLHMTNAVDIAAHEENASSLDAVKIPSTDGSDEVSEEHILENEREIQQDAETEEAHKQDEDLHVSAPCQDSSMEKIDKDVQLCLASTNNSDVTEELPARDDNITEKTDIKESEVLKDDKKPNAKEQEETECGQILLDETVEETKELVSIPMANDAPIKSFTETSEVDHFTSERELTIDREELQTGKTATADDKETRNDEDKGEEEEAHEQKIPDFSSAATNVIEARDQDVAGFLSESPEEIGIAPEEKKSEHQSKDQVLEFEKGEREYAFIGNVMVIDEKSESSVIGVAPEEKESDYESKKQVLESIAQVQSCDIIPKATEMKTEEENTETAAEIKSGNGLAEDIFETKITPYEKESMKVDISSEKGDEDLEDYHLGSCKEEVITERCLESEVSEVSEETDDKAVEHPETILLADESIDHQKEQGKSGEEVTAILDTEEVKSSNMAVLENEEKRIGAADKEMAKDEVLLNQNSNTSVIDETAVELPKALDENIICEAPPTKTVHETIEEFEGKNEDANTKHESLPLPEFTQGKDSEKQDQKYEICTPEEQAEDEENFTAGKGKEEAEGADTWTKPTEDEDRNNFVHAAELAEVSNGDGAQDIPVHNENSTTKNEYFEEKYPNKSTETQISCASGDTELIEQVIKDEGVDSRQVEEVSDECKQIKETSTLVEPVTIPTSEIIQEYTVETSPETKDQPKEVDNLPQESNVSDAELKMAQKDGPPDLQNARDINENVQELNEGSVELSDKENRVEVYPSENIEGKVSSEGQKTEKIQKVLVPETLDQEIEEQQPGSTSKAVLKACEEDNIIDNKCNDDLIENSSGGAAEKVSELQSSMEDTAQSDKKEETERQIDSLPVLPHVKCSDIETEEKDLPLRDDVAELEVIPLPSNDKHVVMEPSKCEPEEANSGHKEGTSQKTTESKEMDKPSLMDLLQTPTKKTSEMASRSEDVQAGKADEAVCEDAKSDEEKDDEEESSDQRRPDLGSEAPVMVDMGDADLKTPHKKSHNILSGVGSKVKHSIAKVKKAITGKSSHPKPPSPK